MRERWFPCNWRDKPWDRHQLIPAGGNAFLLLASPEPGLPWIQVALLREDDNLVPAFASTKFWSEWLGTEVISASALGQDQSNSSAILALSDGAQVVAKLFRVVHAGENPEAELLRALEEVNSPCVPRLLAAQYFPWPENESEEYCSGVVTEYIADAVDGLTYFKQLDDPTNEGKLLGELTADLHAALKDTFGPGVAPTSRLVEYLNLARQTAGSDLEQLGDSLDDVVAKGIAALENSDMPKQRIHGDFHLGQLLREKNGNWTIIDFEGEPMRPLLERRNLDLPLRDVAGMLRSISYAADGRTRWEDTARSAFLKGYFGHSGPESDVLTALELEKALYELRYEAQFRPTMKQIPLKTITSVATASERARA